MADKFSQFLWYDLQFALTRVYKGILFLDKECFCGHDLCWYVYDDILPTNIEVAPKHYLSPDLEVLYCLH